MFRADNATSGCVQHCANPLHHAVYLDPFIQVPQFLLDAATRHNQAVQVVCTQPRRLSAIGVAERVAAERGEQVGGSIGYMIRLENR